MIPIMTHANLSSDPLHTAAQASFNPHISVDCVVLGYDGDSLQVLLSRQSTENPDTECNTLKLPGRLIYADESLDDAAMDILNQLTGTRNHYIQQFKTFGDPDRTRSPKDILWLEHAVQQKIDRIVTVGYMSLVRINNRTHRTFAGHDACWHPVANLPQLAFDHNRIIAEALQEVDRLSAVQPQLLFEMLPAKFTALQLRRLYEQVQGHPIDVRNFHKLVINKSYIVPLDEWETNVSHRAARYYRFASPKRAKV
jgi:hypothetical protein